MAQKQNEAKSSTPTQSSTVDLVKKTASPPPLVNASRSPTFSPKGKSPEPVHPVVGALMRRQSSRKLLSLSERSSIAKPPSKATFSYAQRARMKFSGRKKQKAAPAADAESGSNQIGDDKHWDPPRNGTDKDFASWMQKRGSSRNLSLRSEGSLLSGYVPDSAPSTRNNSIRTKESSLLSARTDSVLSSCAGLPLEPVKEKLARKSLEPRSESKAAVVAQFKEHTIEYKAKVEQLGSELRKARAESKHFKELADKLKGDLGTLLKRSFNMLREARDQASEYKKQLDELRKEKTQDNGRLSPQSVPTTIRLSSADLTDKVLSDSDLENALGSVESLFSNIAN